VPVDAGELPVLGALLPSIARETQLMCRNLSAFVRAGLREQQFRRFDRQQLM
jgi:hypothetical protein